MLALIQNNPYRLLGIYSNSPTKERVANHNRLKAYIKVGKEVSFPLDIPLLPSINRTSEMISDADGKLTLPNDQLLYAQFWFANVTPIDNIAMNHLIAGNVAMAVSIWEKKENVSSLQNRIVCALIQENYSIAITCAEKLYSSYITDFVNIVLGECHTIDESKLEYDFLDKLCSAIGAKTIIPYLHNNNWKQYVSTKTIKPLIDTLQSAIDTAKASRGKGVTARYNAGVKLMNDTQMVVSQLKALLSVSDLQYQVIVDKLGLEILQCGIDYFNGSNDTDSAHKAMRLQSYALSIVVGQMAKDRCKENVDILQNIINDLPPIEVFAEDKAIKEELRKIYQLPNKIAHALTLLNNTKPHLQSIRTKLGSSNAYYLKLSTLVVDYALLNVIEEVNALQNDSTFRQLMIFDSNTALSSLKTVLTAAWKATEIMDTFDMESDFKTNRYNQNRTILKNLCDQVAVPTTTYVPRQPPVNPTPSHRNVPSDNIIISFFDSNLVRDLFIVGIIAGGGVFIGNEVADVMGGSSAVVFNNALADVIGGALSVVFNNTSADEIGGALADIICDALAEKGGSIGAFVGIMVIWNIYD